MWASPDDVPLTLELHSPSAALLKALNTLCDDASVSITTTRAHRGALRQAKVVHFVRHGHAKHNFDPETEHKPDLRDPENRDAALTARGHAQCDALVSRLRRSTNFGIDAATSSSTATATTSAPRFGMTPGGVQLVVTSPLTRCLETATHAFPPGCGVPIVALECVRECVNYNCDARRPVSELRQQFPHVDFSQIVDDEDPVWAALESRFGPQEAHRRPRESGLSGLVAARAQQFVRWLQQRPERELCVFSHSAFLNTVTTLAQPRDAQGRRKHKHKTQRKDQGKPTAGTGTAAATTQPTSPDPVVAAAAGSIELHSPPPLTLPCGDPHRQLCWYADEEVAEAMQAPWGNCELRTAVAFVVDW